MNDILLTLNVGSSNLKYAVFSADEALQRLSDGQIERDAASGGLGYSILQQLERDVPQHTLKAVCHRIVHGGKHYTQPVEIDTDVLNTLRQLAPLAPLHLPPEIEVIEEIADASPVTQIACFDTAFHATQPDIATQFALPHYYHDDGIRRYGFHGLSYDYIASQMPEIVGDAAQGNVIVAHLGNGASMCAMKDRKSIATTMGFSALDGLMMGTRCGSVDAGVLLYLLQDAEQCMGVKELSDMLYKQSGLLGVSGISHDVRILEASDDPSAAKALELYCYRAAKEMGSLIMTLGGLDALIFTGGIGEHSAHMRAMICAHLKWMGLSLDATENAHHASTISCTNSSIGVHVIPTDEELMMARYGVGLLNAS